MNGNKRIEKGIPISPSLDPIINLENEQAKKGDSKKRMLTISFYSFLIAIATSVIAKFLVLLINLITNLSTQHVADEALVDLEYLRRQAL